MSQNTTSRDVLHHLQLLVEQDKTALARVIHDELGGFLIATAMDLSLLKRRFVAADADTREKIERATGSLNEAIDMMRRVTEELHPTLLDNVGLFSAVRWQIKQMCGRTNITCHEDLPEDELRLGSATSISLFRVAQEALIVVENQAAVSVVEISIRNREDSLMMQVSADGSSVLPDPSARSYVALELLKHRIEAMAGSVAVGHSEAGGLQLTMNVRLDAKGLSDTRAVRVLEERAAPPGD